MTSPTDRIDEQARCFRRIEAERDRQEDEFGVQVHDPVYWYAILGKQMGQLGEAVVQRKWAEDKDKNRIKMMHEATQVAAVAVALMEAIGLDELPDEITSAQPKDPRQRAKAMGIGHEAINYDAEPQTVGPASALPVIDVELPNTAEEGMSNDLC